MDCAAARVAISAALDGELDARSIDELDSHLSGCPECRGWRERAHAVTRRARIALAPVAPSAPPQLVNAVARTAWRPEQLTPTRLALVAVAVLQLAVTLPQLVLGSDHLAPVHVAREMGAFDVALAVGFLLAAWHPQNARGMYLLVGAIALLLVVTASVDIAAGHTTPAAEAPHLLAVAGWMLLRVLALHWREEDPLVGYTVGREGSDPDVLLAGWQADETHALSGLDQSANAREAVG